MYKHAQEERGLDLTNQVCIQL